MWRRRKGDNQKENLINQFGFTQFYIRSNQRCSCVLVDRRLSCWFHGVIFPNVRSIVYCLSKNVAICRMKIQRWHQGNDYANFKENIAHIRFDIYMMIVDRWSHIAHHWTMPTIKITWTHSIRNRSVKINFVCITSSSCMIHRRFLSNYIFDFHGNALWNERKAWNVYLLFYQFYNSNNMWLMWIWNLLLI